MNDLRDLIYILDGFSIENTGFMVLEAHKVGDFWRLKVQGYCKCLADSTYEDPISTLTLVERIENKNNFNGKKWNVLKVEELEDNMYNLNVKEYREELSDSSYEDSISTFTLVERIENKYNSNGTKWNVLKVEEVEDSMYNLTVKEYREDNKNEENNDPEGEQV